MNTIDSNNTDFLKKTESSKSDKIKNNVVALFGAALISVGTANAACNQTPEQLDNNPDYMVTCFDETLSPNARIFKEKFEQKFKEEFLVWYLWNNKKNFYNFKKGAHRQIAYVLVDSKQVVKEYKISYAELHKITSNWETYISACEAKLNWDEYQNTSLDNFLIPEVKF